MQRPDNLNTHHPASLYEAFEPAEARRIAERLEIHYTKLERNRQYDGRWQREMFYANGLGAGWGTDTSINGFEAAAQTLEYSDDPRRFCTILEAQIERERARVNEEINSNPDAHAHTTGNSCNATNTNANTVAYPDRLRGCVRQPDPRLQDMGWNPMGL